MPGVIYKSGQYSYSLGTTNEDGTVKKQLFDGTYSMQASINGTQSKEKSVQVSTNGIETTFTASNVQLNFSGEVTYQAGNYSHHYTNGIALFPGTYTFKFGKWATPYLEYELNIGDEKLEKSIAYMSLKDSKGYGISGATAKYYNGGWYNATEVTDQDGNMLIVIDGLAGNVIVQAWDKGANNSSAAQELKTNAFYQFQTKLVTFELLDSKGIAFPSDQYAGQFYAQSWKNFGIDNDKNKQVELLPGKYSFGVNHNGAWMQKEQDITQFPTVQFQTGLVIVHFAGGNVQYYKGGWKNYTGPVELLPVAHDFYFGKTGAPTTSTAITPIAGAIGEKSISYVRLVDSKKVGIPGANLHYYDGGWKNYGSTDKNGVSLVVMDGKKANLTFRMIHQGANQDIPQNISLNSFVDFETVPVTVNLLDSTGQPIIDGGSAQFYAGSWQKFDAAKEMLPYKYTFRMNYNGATLDQQQDIRIDKINTVDFKTVKVSVELRDSGGQPIQNGYAVQYYASSWKPFGGANAAPIEMLPYKYTFRMNYNGKNQDMVQDIAKNPNVSFSVK